MKEDRIKDIRRRLERHEMNVPEGLWESISEALDSSMDANELHGDGRMRRRNVTIPMWVRAAMAVAAVWLAGFIVFPGHDNDETEPVTAVRQTGTAMPQKAAGSDPESSGRTVWDATPTEMLLAENKTTRGNDSTDLYNNPSYIYNKVSAGHDKATAKASISGDKIPAQASTAGAGGNIATLSEASSPATVAYNTASTGEDNAQTSGKSTSDGTPEQSATAQDRPKEHVPKTVEPRPTENKRYKNLYEEDYNRRMTARSERSGGRIDIGASVSNGLVAYNGMGPGMSRPAHSIAMSDRLQNDMVYSMPSIPEQAELLQMAYANLLKDEEVHHDIPVQFGFTVRYSLNDRWAVESGLTYTHLRSTFSSGDDERYSSSVQRLNYVGIPLGMTYSLWTVGGLNLYASVGGAVAKCVAGTIDTETVIDGKTIDYATFKEDTEKPWQLSVNGAVGIQYSFVSNLSLYAEPSINYYFSDGSPLDTYYSKHPWTPGIKVGLRLKIK